MASQIYVYVNDVTAKGITSYAVLQRRKFVYKIILLQDNNNVTNVYVDNVTKENNDVTIVKMTSPVMPQQMFFEHPDQL